MKTTAIITLNNIIRKTTTAGIGLLLGLAALNLTGCAGEELKTDILSDDTTWIDPNSQMVYKLDPINRTASVDGYVTAGGSYTIMTTVGPTINRGKVAYTVTEIGRGAFLYSKLQIIVIESTVKKIGSLAFMESKGLRAVYLKGAELPETGTELFEKEILRDGILYVRSSLIEAARLHPVWGEFSRIEILEE